MSNQLTSLNQMTRVAGNGLLHRRHLLGLGLATAGVAITGSTLAADSNSSLQIPVWSKTPGPGPSDYGSPSPYTAAIRREAAAPNPLYPGGGASRTPLHLLQGSITPNSLHFERHHAGIPAINPDGHRLIINGLVDRALSFSYQDLLAYPLQSRFYFLECSGNSGSLLGDRPVNGSAQSIHGLLSCAQWTGVPLSTLLDEAGVQADANWLSAVGADAASMGRSIPLHKALQDVMIALYQNGEPIRPEQGYPMRLFVPGWEGNVSVKWLTQLKLTNKPSQFRDETSKYTDTLPNRSSLQFTFPMAVKSVITTPSGLMQLERQGIYSVNGLAWSGAGSITKVEVSADSGRSWAEAEIDTQQHSKSLTRFRLPWQWQGQQAVLQSRATDEKGNVQVSRDTILAQRGSMSFYHYSGIQSWAVAASGAVTNVYS